MKKSFAWILTIALCLSMFSPFAVAESLTYADTIAWDGEYDVVVAGFGAAGGTAASYAADAGAKVLLVEKAPEAEAGGNSRVCGQMFVYGHEDEEATYAYYQALGATHDVPEEMLRRYTNQIAHMYSFVSEMFGIDSSNFTSWGADNAVLGPLSPEYPEFPGSDKISLNSLNDTYGDSFLYKNVKKRVTDRAENIDVWYESPAVKLIQDPVNKTILGVTVEREGRQVNIRAKNGVVLATGGFENNQEMVETYLGYPITSFSGGSYNTGDGIRMAMEVGADMWHMDVYESNSVPGAPIVGEGESPLSAAYVGFRFTSGSCMIVGADGSRFIREDEAPRHGHTYYHGTWENPHRPVRSFVVYDQAHADTAGDLGEFQDNVIAADTLEELAEKTGMDADILASTVARYNEYAQSGMDQDFGRSAESMTAIADNGPYYALEMTTSILNTQGGPRRNENAEVLDYDGNPIPHLYSAGELGGICAHQYQGGGNIAECLIFGKIAGENAAAGKNDASAELTKVESSLVYTPGAVTDLAQDSEYEVGDNQVIGISENGMGGKLVVRVTLDGEKIAAVEILEQKETPGISDPAIEQVPAAIVAANSTEVDTAAGATVTSKAIIEAVNNALSQAQ